MSVSRFPQACRWIWPRDAASPNTHVLIRKDIELDADAQIEIRFAVETFAEVYLDGVLVHRYNSVSYPKQHYFEHIILEAVCGGMHQLAFVVNYVGVPSGATSVKDPGFIAEIINTRNGESVQSDEQWSYLVLDAWKGQERRAPFFNLEFIERVDLRDLPAQYPSVPLDKCQQDWDSNPYPGCRMPLLEQRSYPFLQSADYRSFYVKHAGQVNESGLDNPAHAITQEGVPTTALAIDSLHNYAIPALGIDKAFTIFIELDNYITGYPCLDIIAEDGAIIDIAWHEYADHDRLDFIRSKLSAADRYVLSEGLNSIRSEEWKAMRYVQITLRNSSSPSIIKDFFIERSEYPLREHIQLTCEQKILQRIIDISLNATRLCMHGIIMDCPWREKRQWIGDIQRIALVNHYSFQDQALVRAVLLQHCYLQSHEGQMWPCQPLEEELPSQSVAWLRAVLEFDEAYGDTELLQRVELTACRLADWFASKINAAGLFHPKSSRGIHWIDNNFSAIRPLAEEHALASMNLLYAMFLDDMAALLQRLNKDASNYLQAAKMLRQKIVDHFYDAERSLIAEVASDASAYIAEYTQALAINVQLPGVDQQQLWDAFVAFKHDHAEHCVLSSPFAKYQTHEALGRLGRKDAILADIMEYWQPMVAAGSHTTWEVFADAGHQSLAAHSQCHAWAAIPIVALLRHVFGLELADLMQASAAEIEHAVYGRLAYQRL